jgi:hypothetical protein
MYLNDVLALRRGIHGLGYIYRDAGGNVISTPWEAPQTISQRQESMQQQQQQQQAAIARQASVQAAAARQREYEQRTQAEADRRAAEEDRRAAQRERREAERARREAERARRRSPVSVPTPAPSSVPPSTYVAPLTPPATPRLYIASRPAETQVLPPTSQPVDAPVAPGGAPVPKTPDVVAVTYELQIEGVSVGSFGKLDDAVKAALAATTPGDRFEVLFNGKTTGLHVRTTDGSVDVPADIDSQVRLMSRDKMGQFVAKAETKTTTSSSLAWWLIPIAGAAVVAAKVL